MPLGRSEILKLVIEKKLIENFSEDCLEGAGYDLRVGRIYALRSGAHLGVKKRETPKVEELEFEEHLLKPGEYILLETVERVNMPENLLARILPRSTVFRSGCLLITAVVDPGFQGTLTMGLKNVSDFGFKLEKNAKVAQIVFEEVQGKTKVYGGKYQGGKVV